MFGVYNRRKPNRCATLILFLPQKDLYGIHLHLHLCVLVIDDYHDPLFNHAFH